MASTNRIVRWMTATAAVGVLTFVVSALPDATSARVQGGITLDIVVNQEKCPATLVAATSTTSAAYAKAKLHNAGPEQIRAVTFAVVVHRRDGNNEKPVMIQGPRVAVQVEPGATVELTPAFDASALSRALQAGRNGTAAELGILEVELKNGSVWRSPARTLGHFGTKPSLISRSRNCGPGFLTVVHALGLDDEPGVFKCTETSNRLYCTNHNTSCTSSECPSGECAMQVCTYTIAE